MLALQETQSHPCLSQDTELHYLDSYAALKGWYESNPGRFVSLIIQSLEYSPERDGGKLLDCQCVKYPVPAGLDPVAFQGLLIYASLRHENLDRVAPVVFVAQPGKIVAAQQFADFFLLPGMGGCHFTPGPLTKENCCNALAERMGSIMLRPLSEDERRSWRETHEMAVGQSRRMVSLVNEIRRVGPTDSTVLLLGEPGVGKELVANALHRLSHRYSDKPEQRRLPHTVNIASLGHSLLEDDLFGHVRGAFTGAVAERKGIFEAARGSTVFLDEIGDISREVQVRLLRAIEYHRIKRLGSSEEKEVDMRVIAATNRPLEEIQVRFRPDFYARLLQNCIVVPSVKERWQSEPDQVLEEDVAELADHFITRMNNNPRHVRKLSLDPDALGFLCETVRGYLDGTNALFGGNVRTLRSLVERAYERAQFEQTEAIRPGQMISALTLIRFITTQTRQVPRSSIGSVVGSLNLVEVERRAISEAMELSNGSTIRAAELLGIHRETLRRKLAEQQEQRRSRPNPPPEAS